MKKITLLILTFFISFLSYSQMALEGFESTTGPDLAAPTTPSPWTLGTGVWSVFDNGVGLAQRWGINSNITTPVTVYAGTNAAYINRENVGGGNTSEDYLATPLVTIPTGGQLRFWTRSTISGDQGTVYQIKINTTNGTQNTVANYTLVQQWTEATLNTTYNIYEEKVVDLSAYAGQQVYVAFVMKYAQPAGQSGIGGDRWLVDNAQIVLQCAVPTALAATPAATTANLSWTSTATSWEVEVVPTGTTPTGTGTVYNGTLPYPATGLTANTSYDYYVRALCGGGINSAWVGPFPFTTTIAPIGCGGNYVDSGGATASYSNNENTSTLICPSNATDLVTVTFTLFDTESCCDHLSIYDGSNASAPLIGTYQGTTLPPAATSSVPGGCLYFVFTSDISVTHAGWVANISCTPAPACSKPITLVTSAVLATTATVSWTQPINPDNSTASAWEYLLVPCGGAVPTAATPATGTATNPLNLTGLSPTTCYTIYSRAVCSSTNSSAWSTGVNFTTQALPPVCGGNYVDSGGTTASYSNNENTTTTICPTNATDLVTVNFTAFDTESCCDHLSIYDGSSASAPLIGTYQGTTLPPSATSSTPGGCLTFVFTSDVSVTHAGWIANITCAPAPTCSKPTNLTVTTNSSTTATLNWTQPLNPDGSQATSWQVIIQPAGAGTPSASATGITVNASQLPYNVSGLTPGTSYEYWVSAICTSTDHSTWSGPKPFFTSIACGDSQPFCGQNGLNYQNTTGAPSYGTINCLFTTPNPAWYYFQVQQSGPLTFQIAQTSTGGTGLDVDFACWGPFTQAEYSSMCSNLYDYPAGNTTVPNNLVACSYSTAAVENFTIPNAVVGQYYAVLITNYSNQVGAITFNQTNNGTSGSGSTNCDIVCSVDLGLDQVLCNQTSYTINATTQGADSYAWYNGTTLIAGATTSSLVVTQSGSYKCVIVCGLNTVNDTINITFNTAVADVLANVSTCTSYTLPVLSANNNYYTGTGGTGTMLTAGTLISTSQTIYIYAVSGTCTNQSSFTVTIGAIVADVLTNVSACSSYTLPVLSANNNYYTGTGGTGTMLTAGTIISTSQTIYIYAVSGTCTNQSSFIVTIGTITADVLANVSACSSYTLPVLSANNNYYTGTGGTGTMLTAGTIISTSQTIYIYAVSGTCTNQSSFIVTIGTITADVLANVSACSSYTLPVLSANNNYYTGTGGTGTMLTAGTVISTSQTIYIYAVSGTCTNQSSFIVTIGTITADVLANVAVCTSYTLPVLSANNNYYTGTGGTGTMLTAGTIISTSQTIYIYAVSGTCTNQSSFIVTVNPIPTASIAGTTAVCYSTTASSTITFTGANGIAPYIFTYNTGGANNTVTSVGNTATVSIPNTATTTVTLVSVQDSSATACSQLQSGTATVTVNPLPTASIAGSTAVCYSTTTSSTITFTGANGTSPYIFTYNTGGANTTVTSVGNTATVSIPNTATTTVTLVSVKDSSATACSQLQSGTATVTVNPLPTASIAGSTAVCYSTTASSTITFTGANGTSPYIFTYTTGGANTTITSVGNTATVSIPNTATTTVTLVSVKDSSATACSQLQSGTATVTVNPLPTASIAGTTAVCYSATATSTITFTGANGTSPYIFTYSLDGGTTTSTVTSVGNTVTVSIPNTANTTVTLVSVKDSSATACSQLQSGTATVTVNPLPTASIAGTTAVCYSTTASSAITFTGANGTAPYIFTYTTGGANTTITSVGNTATVSIPNTATTTVTLVSVKDSSATACSQLQSGTATVTVNPLPTASIAGTTAVCYSATATSTITFTGANGTSPYIFTYNTGGANTTVTSVGNTATISIPNTATTTVTLISVKDSSVTACSQLQSGTATVTVNPLPTVVVSSSTVCQGASATVTATPGNSSATYTYAWIVPAGVTTPATTVSSFTTSVAGTYSVVITDATTNCVSASASGTVVFSIGVDFTFTDGCDNDNFMINVIPSNNSFDANTANYVWTFGTSSTTINDAQFNVTSYLASLSTQPTLPYTLNVVVSNPITGCSNSHSIILNSVYCAIQKGISPNGDGKNDFFDLKTLNVSKLEIFNRYGMKIYDKENYINEWQGQDTKGDILPDGTYYYVIEFKSGSEPKTGWIYINTDNK